MKQIQRNFVPYGIMHPVILQLLEFTQPLSSKHHVSKTEILDIPQCNIRNLS